MSEPRRDEKDEKEQGEEEKRNEKEEKSREEKWRRDPLSAIALAAILIWAGLVLLADNLRLFARFERLEAWAIILVGAGVIVLLGAVVRLLVPAYRRPVTGSIIFGFILVGIGLGELTRWAVGGALVLLAIGVSIILSRFVRGA